LANRRLFHEGRIGTTAGKEAAARTTGPVSTGEHTGLSRPYKVYQGLMRGDKPYGWPARSSLASSQPGWKLSAIGRASGESSGSSEGPSVSGTGNRECTAAFGSADDPVRSASGPTPSRNRTYRFPPAPKPDAAVPHRTSQNVSVQIEDKNMQRVPAVNEFDLLRFTQCPLFVARPDGIQGPADSAAADAAAEDTFQWITNETFDRGVPELHAVRERADAFFAQRYSGDMTLPIARRLIRLSRRLHDLVFFNEVLHPVSPYQLDLGLVRVKGNLAILRSKTKAARPPRVIRLRPHRVEPPVVPDVVSLARWLYGLRESGFPDCVVYNYALTGNAAASQHYSERVAQRWLTTAAMHWRNKQVYPSTGDHCRDCQQPCLKIPEVFSRDS